MQPMVVAEETMSDDGDTDFMKEQLGSWMQIYGDGATEVAKDPRIVC